jgi:hypothetical protein
MKCKNCETDLKAGVKFCSGCGFPQETKPEPESEALTLLKNIDARTKKLEDEAEARRIKREEREKDNGKKSDKPEAGIKPNKSILDIF